MKNRIVYLENEWLSEDFLRGIVDRDFVDLVGKVQLSFEAEDKPEMFRMDALKIRENEWDYFLYACPEGEMRMLLENVLMALNVNCERCINLFCINGMDAQAGIKLAKILKPGSRLFDRTVYTNMRHRGKYVLVSAENLSFAANSTDEIIPQSMYEKKKVWASNDMIRLMRLLEKYFSINSESEGYFFDIGANIGTTSVYMKKKLIPNFNVCAFEPMKENFKMLSINFLLNDMSDYSLHNIAMSSVKTEYNMKIVSKNWGMCSITDEEGGNVEKVVSMRLDDYVTEMKIDTDSNIVLWIDTEGFEINVLLGAREVLKSKPALFLEFNRSEYGDRVDEMLALLEENYSGFISFSDEIDIIRTDFSILKDVTAQTDLFLVP